MGRRITGVEGTIPQGVRSFGLRRCRCNGLAKGRLRHHLAATALNFHPPQRLVDRDPTSPHTHITPGSPSGPPGVVPIPQGDPAPARHNL
jgi:hypothetical protein